jgi:predicted HD superfamily hydrolase involved in NAD metabolism
MIARLKTKINDKRFVHSVAVEYVAGSMAMVLGEDVEKARVAGLLHDCAKGLTQKEKLAKAKKHELEISDYENKNPDMLHGKLGAYYANAKYEVSDQDILNAITYHTTGRPGMSLLEKIIFVADYIEPNRKPLPGIEEIRREAFFDIDRCVLHILKDTLDYLEQDNSQGEIDDMTRQSYKYYKKLCEKKVS